LIQSLHFFLCFAKLFFYGCIALVIVDFVSQAAFEAMFKFEELYAVEKVAPKFLLRNLIRNESESCIVQFWEHFSHHYCKEYVLLKVEFIHVLEMG